MSALIKHISPEAIEQEAAKLEDEARQIRAYVENTAPPEYIKKALTKYAEQVERVAKAWRDLVAKAKGAA